MREYNDEIQECGLRYIAHYNYTQIVLFGKHFTFDIPPDRLYEFIQIFPDMKWEDGEFLHRLKGKYIRVVENDEGEIYSFKHIIDNIEYIVNIGEVTKKEVLNDG